MSDGEGPESSPVVFKHEPRIVAHAKQTAKGEFYVDVKAESIGPVMESVTEDTTQEVPPDMVVLDTLKRMIRGLQDEGYTVAGIAPPDGGDETVRDEAPGAGE